MYSQNIRAFSQEGELSQLTPATHFGQKSPSHIEISQNDNTQMRSNNLHGNCQEYNMQSSGDTQLEGPEEYFSQRADAICEENRQIRSFMENNLKQLEKRRIRIKEKLKQAEEEVIKYLEIHELQAQESIELQMNLEEWTEKYSNVLNQRSELVKATKHTHDIVNVFENTFLEGLKYEDKCKDTLSTVRSELENSTAKLVSLKDKTNKMEFSFTNVMEEKIAEAQELRDTLKQDMDKSICEVQALIQENEELSNTMCENQKKINCHSQNANEQIKTYNEAILQNETSTQEIAKLHRQLNEFRDSKASHIQKLKLQINNEENKNSSLKKELTERENCLNSSSTNLRVMVNLADQLKMAVEEATKRNEEKLKKIEELSEQKVLLINQEDSLAEGIKKLENVESVNHFYKSEITSLEESIKLYESTLNDKKNSIRAICNQKEEVKQQKIQLEQIISGLKNDIENDYGIKDCLASKTKDDLLEKQQERENMILRNKTIEQSITLLQEEINILSTDLDRQQDSIKELRREKGEIEISIKDSNKNIKQNEDKMNVIRRETDDECGKYNEHIEMKLEDLNEYDELLIEIKPKQDELPVLIEKKEALEQNIYDENEKYQKEKDILETNFQAKIMETEKDLEKYASIMQSLLTEEVKATEKLMDELKETEKNKLKHEDTLKTLYQELNLLKSEETSKRNKVEKMEKRLRTINKEVKVTRQDISDAVTGKVLVKQKSSTKLMTPTSSLDSALGAHKKELPPNNVSFLKSSRFLPKSANQENTKKWLDSVADDEYDFSDI